ncbi:MAG: cyclic nucleotide-binding domain-containing protein, partial [Synergistaceae bacterium]|nr:cyclic nucleotide-binding domain-containing protein [Synergistaceae bacterium]
MTTLTLNQKLKQSEYMSIPCDDSHVYTLTSGKVEIYACTPEGSENYHKKFLMALEPGEDFFPPLEAATPLEFSLFAVTDAEISKTETERITPDIFSEKADKWFKKLTDLPWIRYLVAMDDEVVTRWHGENVFGETDKNLCDAVKETFLFNQEIFSMLISGQFGASERHAQERSANWAKQRVKTMFAAMSS